MNLREEFAKRVTNALADLRNEMLAADVPESDLAEKVTITETPDGATVVFFPVQADKKRKKDE